MGKIRYLVFYLGCGFIAALTQAFLNPVSQIPMVGASGAISGVIGAIFFCTHERIFVYFTGLYYLSDVLWYRLIWFSGSGWPNKSYLSGINERGGGVAIAAHLGGFGAGFILTPFSRRRSPAFSRRTFSTFYSPTA